MAADHLSQPELLREIETLRFRLEEAEATLSAIHSGGVDAFVVSSPKGGEQIFTLQGAEHPYRLLVETMNEGAAILNPEGSIVYCNRQLADMLQVPMENLIRAAEMQAYSLAERERAARAIQESEERYRLLAETMLHGVVHQNSAGIIIAMNPAAERILGKRREEFLGSSSVNEEHDTIREDGSPFPGMEHPSMLALRTGQPVRNVLMGVFNPRRNEYRWINVTAVPVFRSGEATPAEVYTVFEDITERKQNEARLQLAASVFTHSREGIVITDADGSIVDVNAAFTYITGYPREEALGRNPRILQSGRHEPAFFTALWHDLITKGHWYGEIWNRRKSGEVYAEMINISSVNNAQGQTQNYVALFSDITLMKEQQQQLEYIAHYDALTGLPNRLLLVDRLEQGMAQTQRRGHSLAVAYIDLDGFKAVNDQYGHVVGDTLLVAVANRMRAALRDVDTLARIGGDEFVAVLADLEHPTDWENLLERLLRAASNGVTIGQRVLQVSASIGVTIYPKDEANYGQLLRHADQAMYSAKQAGKNRYHLFDVNQDAMQRTEQENLAGIRRAMERDEFVLHYQPKVNLKTGAVIGVEALIRWQHPERGILLPAAFLPTINNHPLGVELGDWVINAAFAQIEAWLAQGFDIPVSLNIDANHLQCGGFLSRLLAHFAAHPAVRPDRIELEILESSALEDMGNAAKIMQACCEVGVHFALDDFGTGYASLTYLKRLPVDMLKIDQSFVHGMLHDPEDHSIVEGVIGLAKAFRRQVIAEGVETAGHGERLLALGCDLAQGYTIARPMPGAELPDWVAGWQQKMLERG